jgi:hypothetical protein
MVGFDLHGEKTGGDEGKNGSIEVTCPTWLCKTLMVNLSALLFERQEHTCMRPIRALLRSPVLPKVVVVIVSEHR